VHQGLLDAKAAVALEAAANFAGDFADLPAEKRLQFLLRARKARKRKGLTKDDPLARELYRMAVAMRYEALKDGRRLSWNAAADRIGIGRATLFRYKKHFEG
jgi:DNA invertase Pin-like site-specific DNA recombinase